MFYYFKMRIKIFLSVFFCVLFTCSASVYADNNTEYTSGYYLTEVSESDISEDTDYIVKYEYNSETQEITKHYYTLNLKETEYGDTDSYDETISKR